MAQREKKKDDACQFEKGMAKLEELVARMEEGELSLDAALDMYEQGVALYGQLEAMLQRGKQRIEVLDVHKEEPFSVRPLNDEASS